MVLRPVIMTGLGPGRRLFAVTSATRYIAWMPRGSTAPQYVPGSELACTTNCGHSLRECQATHVESVYGACCLKQTKFDYMNQVVNAESAAETLMIAANKPSLASESAHLTLQL